MFCFMICVFFLVFGECDLLLVLCLVLGGLMSAFRRFEFFFSVGFMSAFMCLFVGFIRCFVCFMLVYDVL